MDAVALVSVLIALGSLFWTVRTSRRKEAGDFEQRIDMLDSRITKLETKMDLFWGSISTRLAGLLHSPLPEHSHRDGLIEAFMAGTASFDQIAELAEELELILDDHLTETGARVAAVIVLDYINAKFDLRRGRET